MRADPPPPPRVEALLRAERALVPQGDDVRQRVLRRARAAIEHSVPRAAPRPWSRLRPLVAPVAALVGITVLVAGVQAWRREDAARSPTTLAPASSNAMPGTGDPIPSGDPPQTTPPAMDPAAQTPLPPAERPRTLHEQDALVELRLLQAARQALAQGEYSSALSALANHERHFPTGRLAEEREALKVTALLGLDRREDARRVASDFRRRFPRSVLLSHMDGVLGGP